MQLLCFISLCLIAYAYSAPIEVHITPTGDSTEMRVGWTTTTTNQNIVEWGLQKGNYNRTAAGSEKRFEVEGYDSHYLYEALLTNLTPDTVYYYRTGSGGAWSPEWSFKTPPSVPRTLRVGIIADLGQTKYSKSVVDGLIKFKPDLIVHYGDISYADGDYERWNSWAALSQPLTATIPYIVGVGNHEDHDNFTPYKDRFLNPWRESGAPDNCFYSFSFGPLAHFTVLSSETGCQPYDQSSAQFTWLKSEIQKITAPWSIMGWHRPWYNSNSCHHLEGEKMREAMESTIYEKADICVSGHTHAYERFHKVYNNKLDNKGPMYVTNGNAGNREGLCKDWPYLSDLSAFHYSDDYGFTILTIHNSTVANWDHYRQSDYSKVDSTVLRK
mmetsp:Transcript_30217/g.33771  ORF Transcript_30217/g.33771 Transcript_30217/m.33771 type:complete len:385 (-) Transcript_30217:57-1211(-)